MATPSLQTLVTDAQQVLNLDSISAVRSVVAVALANANVGTPLNPNLTTQQLWNEFYQVITKPKSDIESIIANQLMKFLFAPPAPGGVASNHEVIYNDNGVLAGDPKFLWDDALNKLDIDGSATITGALTAGGNSVIGTGSTQNAAAGRGNLTIGGTGSAILNLSINGADTGYVIHDGTNISLVNRIAAGNLIFQTNSSTRHQIASDGVCTWSNVGGVAGTAMTLNATGLGVGVVPSTRLHIQNTGDVYARIATTSVSKAGVQLSANGVVRSHLLYDDGAGTTYLTTGTSFGGSGQALVAHSGTSFQIFTNNQLATAQMTLNSSGNVGIGVTPSAWNSSYKALQVSAGIALFNNASGPNNAWLTSNFFFDSSNANTFIGTGYALMYRHLSGEHAWLTSTASGTANAPATMTQMMTLDASGNLLVGTTSTGGSASNATKTVGGSFSTVNGVSASTATAVAVTLFAVPTEAVFIVSAFVPAYAAPTQYNAVSIVRVNGGIATVTALSTGTNISIAMSGLNVQATQLTGGASTISYSAIRIS